MNTPRVVAETDLYSVLYKPHNMHTVPLRAGEGGTLLDWAAEKIPEILSVRGKKTMEGGILHRLDFETAGLVLAAKQQDAYNNLLKQQNENCFIKEYHALCTEHKTSLPGFPAPPESIQNKIVSSFRAFGRGRKTVRPITSGGKIYTTEILSVEPYKTYSRFHLRLTKGFRHQIRAHLAWCGFPILNDTRYGGEDCGADLALEASALQFFEPDTGNAASYVL
jgi:23S rRNA pseudouridine1911/1915/1917 synthase